jgi:hypothetical protein
MHPVVTFWTDKFDVSREDENPINPIPGQSLLHWLRDRVGEEMAFQEPDTEDWGWYSTVAWKGRAYLLGAMAAEREAGGCDWVFQVDKHRTLMEKLLGREKMTHQDECFRFFLSMLENEPEFHDVTVE